VTSSGATDHVLVAALRPPAHAQSLLAALDGLPAPARAVLRGTYLQGRAVEDLAAELLLTPAELQVLRADALRALGRAGLPATQRRQADARGARFSA